MRYAARVLGPNGRFGWLGPPPCYPYKHIMLGFLAIECRPCPIAMSKRECLEVASILPSEVEIMRYPAARVVHRLCNTMYYAGLCTKIDEEKYESKYGKDALQRIYGKFPTGGV